MASIKTVALSGANGSIGAAILKALIDADFTVTVLTRPGSATSFPSGVEVAQVDYNNIESLATILKGQDAVVSAVGFAGILGQKTLVDAAIAAGVKRVIPSEYGSDPDSAARQLPVFAHKVQVEQYIKEKTQGTSTTFSLVCNNQFFDWDLDNDFVVNVKAKTLEIFDGGDTPYTATPLDFVARGVVGVLQRPSETANRVIRLHGTNMTQNKMLEILQRYTGKEGWEVTHTSTEVREREAYEYLQKEPNNFEKWVVAFLHCAVWGERFGNNFAKINDNELLGLKELSESEIEEIIRRRT